MRGTLRAGVGGGGQRSTRYAARQPPARAARREREVLYGLQVLAQAPTLERRRARTVDVHRGQVRTHRGQACPTSSSPVAPWKDVKPTATRHDRQDLTHPSRSAESCASPSLRTSANLVPRPPDSSHYPTEALREHQAYVSVPRSQTKVLKVLKGSAQKCFTLQSALGLSLSLNLEKVAMCSE